MMIEPTWWKYAIFNDNGICGISENAPDAEKEKYRKYIEEIERVKNNGGLIPK